jgi:16S rRNA processing protein RimM
MRKLLAVGKVAKPHGFRGDLIVSGSGGTDCSLSYLTEVFVGKSAENAVAFKIQTAAWMPKGWKLKLTGFESDETVKAHRNELVFVDRALLKNTENNEYYIADLEGAEVLDQDSGKCIGHLVGVESTGSPLTGDRWWVEGNELEIAIPATKRFICKVDSNGRKIWVTNIGELQ